MYSKKLVSKTMTAFFFFSIPSKTFGLRFFMKRRKASYVRKLEEKSRKQQITTIPPNRSPALLDDHLMEIEILEEPKYQSPVVPPATQIKFNRNIHETSLKSSTTNKSQQQKTKKSKLTPEKTISTVMTRYLLQDKTRIRKIVIYDIPSTMPQLDILTNLKKWDQVIAFKVKT
ncbi:unnamed protein product [Rhizophagus irregularis]|nr:unnamed protein product [Rhizophagus irregularis]